MRFSFCNEGFGERPWREVCAILAEAGYDGVEIAPFTFAGDVRELSASARAEIRRVAENAGLQIVGLHWLLVKPDGLHIAHPDQAVRAHTTDYLRRLADFCADLGGRVMVFGSPKQRGGSAGASPPEAWRRAVETFRSVLPTLEERDATICFEPLTTEETDFVNTAAEARQLIEEIGHPNFRLLLDVKAMCREAIPIPDLLRANRDLLTHLHANDANRQAPGFGDVDFLPILAALQEIGYQGYVSLEPFEFPLDVAVVARRSLAYLRGCL